VQKRLNRSRCRFCLTDSFGSIRNHVLDGDQTPDPPTGRGTFDGTCAGPVYMSELLIVRMPPLANVPAQLTRRTNALAAAWLTGRRCGQLPNYLERLIYYTLKLTEKFN